jgi:hypothetical protein
MSFKKQRQAPISILFGLLGLWIGIELFYSSQWSQRLGGDQLRLLNARANSATSLASILSRSSRPRPARVWFSPYLTYPETGIPESTSHPAGYSTFLAFPPTGLTSNYGAFKLSGADTVFSQASTAGLQREALLAQALGYDYVAIDPDALVNEKLIERLCDRTRGCRLSSDRYALFPLDRSFNPWIDELKPAKRRVKNMALLSAMPRWGTLVFHRPDWSKPQIPDQPEADFKIWAAPRAKVSLYRFETSSFPQPAQEVLAANEGKILIEMHPDLSSLQLCIGRAQPWRPFAKSTACHKLLLTTAAEQQADITSLLQPNAVNTIRIDKVIGREGWPVPMRFLPHVESLKGGRSAFSIIIRSSPREASPPALAHS